MKINRKILSIAPYISTHWHNITALRMDGECLIINLLDGTEASIPNLDGETLETIFDMHATVMEESVEIEEDSDSSLALADGGASFQFGMGMEGMGAMGAAMAHNPDQSNAPDLPKEILEKVARVAQIVAPDEAKDLPKPEPHCNCVYCQVARAIQTAMTGENLEKEEATGGQVEEEAVSDDELTFCQWDIQQAGEQLFTVVNRLDGAESYQVFLGQPVGCTCGQSKCEHIEAVLLS